MNRRFLALLLAALLLLTVLPPLAAPAEAACDYPQELYLAQSENGRCTLCATAMLFRGAFYRANNTGWSSITEAAISGSAWLSGVGLNHNFTWSRDGNSIKMTTAQLSGITADGLKALLDAHPEGIVFYCDDYQYPHAVYLTDYEGSTFYCADPATYHAGSRIPLTSSWLGDVHGSQANILKSASRYWYASELRISPSFSGTGFSVSLKDVDTVSQKPTDTLLISAEAGSASVWNDITACYVSVNGGPRRELFDRLTDATVYSDSDRYGSLLRHSTSGSFYRYVVRENGSYIFTLVNNSGDERSASVNYSNLSGTPAILLEDADTLTPRLNLDTVLIGTDDASFPYITACCVSINGGDWQAVTDRCTEGDCNGDWQTGYSGSCYRYVVRKNGSYVFRLEDAGGSYVQSKMLVYRNIGSVPRTLPELSISHSCSLNECLGLNYYVLKSLLSGYSSVKMNVQFERFDGDRRSIVEETVTPTSATISGKAYYRFSFRGIAAAEVGSRVYATVTGTMNGKVYSSEVDEYSIADYCLTVLSSKKEEAMKTLCADTLLYGAAAQAYFCVNPQHLCSDAMTEAQRYLSGGNVELSPCNSEKTFSGTKKASFGGKSYVLNSAPELKLRIVPNPGVDAAKLTVKFTYERADGTAATVKLTPEKDGSDWIVRMNSVAGPDLRSPITIIIYEGSTQVSNTLTFSAEGYCRAVLSNGSASRSLKNLCQAMMNFSASAKAYFT